jgi:hypothetical protein
MYILSYRLQAQFEVLKKKTENSPYEYLYKERTNPRPIGTEPGNSESEAVEGEANIQNIKKASFAYKTSTPLVHGKDGGKLYAVPTDRSNSKIICSGRYLH